MPRIGTRRSTERCRVAAVALLAAAALLPVSAHAQQQVAETEMVDTALVLVVDVSGSVDAGRYTLQMEGIAKAFADPEIQRVITGGPHGAMFVTLVEWSDRPTVTIPWTLIRNDEDALGFAAKVRHAPRRDENGFTCMSRAIGLIADKVLPFLPAPAVRTVVDVSSDGRDNCNLTPTVDALRDELVASNVMVNGLPILEGNEAATLEGWYRDHVIGGVGALLVPAHGFADFERAMREKFIVEISAVPQAE